jgi:cytochrome c553
MTKFLKYTLIISTLSLSAFFFACEDDSEDCGSRNPNAPSDHTVAEECKFHKPGLKNPLSESSACNRCHGADLKGMGSTPSCYKCHDKEWY